MPSYTVHDSLFFNTQLTLRFVSVILTTVVALVWLIFPVSVVIVLFVGMRWYYLKTAREVKRLEAIGEGWQLLIYIAQYVQIDRTSQYYDDILSYQLVVPSTPMSPPPCKAFPSLDHLADRPSRWTSFISSITNTHRPFIYPWPHSGGSL